jgi:Leucine-rich repeat (LRR) protein
MLPGLQFATLISNRFTTANVNAWKFGTALTQLDLSYNALSYFHPTNALPATLTLLDLTNTGLNTGEIDNTLIYLDGLTFNAGAKTLNITQSVPTPPTSTGLAAITSLQSKGWTVNYDAAPTVFNYTIDNTDGTSADQSIRMDGWSGNFSVTVNWGDGSSNTYGDAADYTMTHTYATNSKFTATFTSATPALINEVYVNQTGTQKNITAVGAVTYLTGLNRLQLNKINMANVNSLALPTTLKNYIILALPITTFDPVAALPALNNLTVQTTDITAFAPTQGLPATLTNLDISANKFNATGVNNALIYIDSKTFNAGGKILNVKTYNAANAPTGSGLTAKNNLTAEGWSVTSD